MRLPLYHQVVSAVLAGLEGRTVEIEASILPGLPAFSVPTLGDPASRAVRERVRAAINHSGFHFPKGRVTASCSPVSVRIQGGALDLPLAMAVLAASGQLVRPEGFPAYALIGELALDGRVKPVGGLPIRLLALRDAGVTLVAGPREGEREAACVEGIGYFGCENLREAARFFSGLRQPSPGSAIKMRETGRRSLPWIPLGQEEGLRACVIAAAGWHPLLMLGAPTSGKAALAAAVPGLMPPLDPGELLERIKIQSLAEPSDGEGAQQAERPFRRVSHAITSTGLLGGRLVSEPGECTLASGGVLFLDEINHMPPRTLEILRQVMEGQWPARVGPGHRDRFAPGFLLIAAGSPCPCGLALEAGDPCRCQDGAIRRHLASAGGPLLDHFGLVSFLKRIPAPSFLNPGESPQKMPDLPGLQGQIEAAWALQKARAGPEYCATFHNSRVALVDPGSYFHLGREVMGFAAQLGEAERLSARSFFSILRVARTIADLEMSESVLRRHVAEAFHYRPKLPLPLAGRDL